MPNYRENTKYLFSAISPSQGVFQADSSLDSLEIKHKVLHHYYIQNFYSDYDLLPLHKTTILAARSMRVSVEISYFLAMENTEIRGRYEINASYFFKCGTGYFFALPIGQ